jgi:hypothetical protein
MLSIMGLLLQLLKMGHLQNNWDIIRDHRFEARIPGFESNVLDLLFWIGWQALSRGHTLHKSAAIGNGRSTTRMESITNSGAIRGQGA